MPGGNTTRERDGRQADKRSHAERRRGSVASGLRLLMCACGVVVDDEDDLLDHQAWCQGDAEANQALMARVRDTTGEVSYEGLVAAATQDAGGQPRASLDVRQYLAML